MVTFPAAATNRAVDMQRRRSRLPVLVAGLTLGACASAGDELPGAVGELVLTLTSTGFAWGAAALLAGYSAARRAVALITATGLLVAATVTYYGLVVGVGQRWRWGGHPRR